MSATGSLGLDEARALDPARYSIGVRPPAIALRPGTRAEVLEALRAAARDGLAVVPWGGGTALPYEDGPPRYDVALDLTALDRVVEYEPADVTITAECGVRLAGLALTVNERGQELPIEGAHAGQATLGGALAANASGPRRLRFGSPRDRILGARYALADGTEVRTGGRVVKNVAGYAIHRLLCGSRGGLALLIEASLKLAPAPETRVALVYGATAGELADVHRWSFLPRLEPALVTVLGRAAAAAVDEGANSAFTIVIGLEDDAPWVQHQEAQVRERLGDPRARLEGATAVAAQRALADLADPQDQTRQRLTFATPWNSPAALGVVTGDASAGRLVFHALAGRLHVFPESEAADPLTASLENQGFSLIDARGADVAPGVPSLTALSGLRRRIREALDPARTLALGPRWEAGR